VSSLPVAPWSAAGVEGSAEASVLGRLRRAWTASRLLLAVAAALRVWAAVWDQGLVWPDEIFQTLEQAHRFAFGKGIIPWEFRDGARSWLFPGMIGLAWKGASALGVTSPLGLVRLAKLAMAAGSVAGVWAGMRLARLLGGARAELLAALLGALCPVLVIFGSRCTTETASAPLIVISALLLELEPKRRREALAGALMALAVLFRYQTGLVAAGFVLVLLARRRWKGLLSYLAAASVVAALGGVLDWKTWGSPFHPLVVYVKFNMGPAAVDRWGAAPFTFFSDHLATTVGLSYAVLVLGFAVAAGSAPGLALVVLAYVGAHCAVPHKELRFITPILPLAIALSSVGLARLAGGLHKGDRPLHALAWVLGAQMVWQLRAPTLADLGYGDDEEVVWHANEDYYRATLDAAALPDLCGISYIDNAHAWTGGYTYLHRDVPVFFSSDARDLAAANYLIAKVDTKVPRGWEKVKIHDRFALYHREGGCGPVPPTWTLDQL
jgi:phosphatidylinositol glycan class B